MAKKILVVIILFVLLYAYLSVFSTISYANSSDEEIINIVKNISKYYVFDIDKFQSREIDIVEYSRVQIENYITQLINDSSIRIDIEEIGGGGSFNTYEWDANVKIYRDETLLDIVQFKRENNTQITMFGLITVPYEELEKLESEKISYAKNILENRYMIESLNQSTYEIEKTSPLNSNDIVLLDTDKFGTVKFSKEENSKNLYSIIYSNNQDETIPLMIMQKKYTDDDYKNDVYNLIKNIPKYYVFDIDKFYSQDITLLEYAKQQLEDYMENFIDDDTRRISIDILENRCKFNTIEFSADIKILKNNILENTVHFGWDTDNSITIFALITVPYGIKNEQRFLLEYARNIIENKYNYPYQYELERKQRDYELSNKDIILLGTEKFGTKKYYNGQLTLYNLIPQNDVSNIEPLIIMQEPSINIGKGTEEEPYLISTPEQLSAIRNNLSACYKLVNDIDLTYDTSNVNGIFYNNGKGWKPIEYTFSGKLYGNNKKIIGLTQNIDNENAGLFNEVTGKIIDLNMQDININAIYNATEFLYCNVAGLTSDLNGEIDNISISGNIKVDIDTGNANYLPSFYVGGIAGKAFNATEISNAINRANITVNGTDSTGNYGGIIGMARNIKITNSKNYGNIKSNQGALGGIIGDIDSYNGISEITNCENKGTLTSKGNIGGIAGINLGTTIKYCKNYGNIFSNNAMGGIVGYNSNSTDKNNVVQKATIEECFNTGSLNILIEGNQIYNRLGGISSTNSGEIRNCFNSGIVNISGYNRDRSEFIQFYIGIGGIVGENDGNIYTSYSADLGNANYSGNLIDYINMNALVGKVINNNCIIKDCYYLDNGLYTYSDINDEKIKTYGNLTLDEMQLEESYIGFDFENIWYIEKTASYKFPKLIRNDIDEEIFQKGDINGDGKVNIKDWNRMYNHINETELLTEEEFERADINEDGKVNIKDWNRMYDHITEVNPLW